EGDRRADAPPAGHARRPRAQAPLRPGAGAGGGEPAADPARPPERPRRGPGGAGQLPPRHPRPHRPLERRRALLALTGFRSSATARDEPAPAEEVRERLPRDPLPARVPVAVRLEIRRREDVVRAREHGGEVEAGYSEASRDVADAVRDRAPVRVRRGAYVAGVS